MLSVVLISFLLIIAVRFTKKVLYLQWPDIIKEAFLVGGRFPSCVPRAYKVAIEDSLFICCVYCIYLHQWLKILLCKSKFLGLTYF